MGRAEPRTPVTLVAGCDRTITARIAYTLLRPGTTVISHDLRGIADGHVTRLEHRMAADGTDTISIDDIELEHGCVSCTLRVDLLPMLHTLHRDPEVDRIVLLLDPAIEPERLTVEVRHTIVDVADGEPAPASTSVEIDATICGISARTWLADATGDITLHEAGMSVVDDERTLAQVSVAQARFADALIIDGADALESAYELAQLHATLVRLAPSAGMRTLNSKQLLSRAAVQSAITAAGPQAPHGRPRHPFDPLLTGAPDLESECGVQLMSFEADRPFHPERLHVELDVLLDGVVAAHGRLWLASAPDAVMWLESAGGALGISHVGTWLACVDDPSDAHDEHQAMAALRWDDVYGDRHTALTVLVYRGDAEDIRRALIRALVTDVELAGGPKALAALPSPFGHDHHDPCEDMAVTTDDGLPASFGPNPNNEGPTP